MIPALVRKPRPFINRVGEFTRSHRWEFQEVVGRPEIFNTDQGCQFTSQDFTGFLKAQDIQISMDRTGRWCENVFVERLCRASNAKRSISPHPRDHQRCLPGISTLAALYNRTGPDALDGRTPNRVYVEVEHCEASLKNGTTILSKQAEPPPLHGNKRKKVKIETLGPRPRYV